MLKGTLVIAVGKLKSSPSARRYPSTVNNPETTDAAAVERDRILSFFLFILEYINEIISAFPAFIIAVNGAQRALPASKSAMAPPTAAARQE